MAPLAVVPFLGAFVIWVPAALILALAGDLASSCCPAVWGTIVVGLVDNVMYPMLVARRLMLHTIPSFIAVAGGVVLLGAPGIVTLGPVIVAVSVTLLEILRHRAIGGIEGLNSWRRQTQRQGKIPCLKTSGAAEFRCSVCCH